MVFLVFQWKGREERRLYFSGSEGPDFCSRSWAFRSPMQEDLLWGFQTKRQLSPNWSELETGSRQRWGERWPWVSSLVSCSRFASAKGLALRHLGCSRLDARGKRGRDTPFSLPWIPHSSIHSSSTSPLPCPVWEANHWLPSAVSPGSPSSGLCRVWISRAPAGEQREWGGGGRCFLWPLAAQGSGIRQVTPPPDTYTCCPHAARLCYSEVQEPGNFWLLGSLTCSTKKYWVRKGDWEVTEGQGVPPRRRHLWWEPKCWETDIQVDVQKVQEWARPVWGTVQGLTGAQQGDGA